MSEPKKIGKTFAFIFWGLFLLLGYQFFDNKLAQRTNPNQSPESYVDGGLTTLVLQQNRMGHYVTNGMLNNYPVTFMLDTGATNVAVPKHIADAIGLQYGQPISVNTANGTAKAYMTNITSLSIGKMQFGAMRATIVPGMTGDELLLGMNALKQVEFTQKNGVLTLKQ
jgi:aspartyl protease family protein